MRSGAGRLLPRAFHVCRPEEGESIVFAWLVPITANEASFVRSRGWSAFEKKLEEHDPDLLDMPRPSFL
jgi:hypothetical protein